MWKAWQRRGTEALTRKCRAVTAAAPSGCGIARTSWWPGTGLLGHQNTKRSKTGLLVILMESETGALSNSLPMWKATSVIWVQEVQVSAGTQSATKAPHWAWRLLSAQHRSRHQGAEWAVANASPRHSRCSLKRSSEGDLPRSVRHF